MGNVEPKYSKNPILDADIRINDLSEKVQSGEIPVAGGGGGGTVKEIHKKLNALLTTSASNVTTGVLIDFSANLGVDDDTSDADFEWDVTYKCVRVLTAGYYHCGLIGLIQSGVTSGIPYVALNYYTDPTQFPSGTAALASVVHDRAGVSLGSNGVRSILAVSAPRVWLEPGYYIPVAASNINDEAVRFPVTTTKIFAAGVELFFRKA